MFSSPWSQIPCHELLKDLRLVASPPSSSQPSTVYNSVERAIYLCLELEEARR